MSDDDRAMDALLLELHRRPALDDEAFLARLRARLDAPAPPRRSIRWAAAAVLLLGAGLTTVLIPRHEDPIRILSGHVERDGLSIRTRPGGEALLALKDVGQLRLYDDARLQVREERSSWLLEQPNGRVGFDVDPRDGRPPVRISTPAARVEVVGTRFDVTVRGPETRVDVREGKVRVFNTAGEILLGPEESATCVQDEPPRTARTEPALPEGAILRIGSPTFRASGRVAALAYSPDGERLAFGGRDLTVLHSTTGRSLGSAPDLVPNGIESMEYSRDGRRLLVSGSGDAVVVDASTLKPEAKADTGAPVINRTLACFLPDGTRIAYLGPEWKLCLFDIGKSETTRMLESGFQGAPAALAVSRDGGLAAAADNGGRVCVWDLKAGAVVAHPGRLGPRDGFGVSSGSLAFSPDGKILILAWDTGGPGSSPSIVFWSLPEGKELDRIERFEDDSRIIPCDERGVAVAFSPDGRTLAVATRDRLIRLWEVGTREFIRQIDLGPECVAYALTFSPDGRRLAAGDSLGRIRQWDPATGKALPPSADDHSPIHAARFSPDGRFLAAGMLDNTVRIFETATGRETARLTGEAGFTTSWNAGITGVAFAPDGRSLIASRHHGVTRAWDVATGREIRKFMASIMDPRPLALAPDGRPLIAQKAGGELSFWPGETTCNGQRTVWGPNPFRAPFQILANGTGEERRALVALSGDGRWIAWSNLEKCNVEVFDSDSFQPRFLLRTPAGEVALSPDGRVLATQAGDQVHLWEIATGGEIARFPVKECGPLAFSPDGRLIAGAGIDARTRRGILVVAETLTGRIVDTIDGHATGIGAVDFSPDGSRLLTAGFDGTALIWKTDRPRWKQPVEAIDGAPADPWAALSEEPAVASKAAALLVRDPARTVREVDARIPAPQALSDEEVRRRIADLDSEDVAVRSAAADRLAKAGAAVEPQLSEALRTATSPEAKAHLQDLLKRFRMTVPVEAKEALFQLRVVRVLEWIGTREARAAVELVGRRATYDIVRSEAAAAVLRLK